MAKDSDGGGTQVVDSSAEPAVPARGSADPATRGRGAVVTYSFLELIPVQCNSFALGLVGLANVVLNLHALFFKVYGPGQDEVRTLAGVILMAAVGNQLLYFIKVLSNPRKTWRTDFCTHSAIGAQTLAITLGMFSITVLRVLPHYKAAVKPLATLAVWFAATVLQPLTMMRFYGAVLRDGAAISTAFFAPSVSVAILGLTGGAVGVEADLLAKSVGAGACMMLLLFPVCLLRALRRKEDTASPAIGMLQAPCSFCCAAYFAARKVPEAGELMGPDFLEDIFFGLSVLGVLATLYCSLRRRHALYASWPSPAWAAFTFPSASSANVALARAASNPHPAYTAYALAVCAVAVPLIVAINLKHMTMLSSAPTSRTLRAKKKAT